MTYLLDNNVLQYFFHAGREQDLIDVTRKTSLAIAREVFEEACRGKHGARARKLLPGEEIIVFDIVVGSPVDQTLQALRPLVSTSGGGERESIALAVHDPGLVFVANDKNAMWMALHELHTGGERMIGVPVFLRRLHATTGLAQAVIDDVMRYWSGRRPTWWPSWRASIEPAEGAAKDE